MSLEKGDKCCNSLFISYTDVCSNAFAAYDYAIIVNQLKKFVKGEKKKLY